MSLRDGPFGTLKVPLTWTAAVALIVAAVLALAFLLGDRRETLRASAYDQVRRAADHVTRPIGEGLSAPVGWARGAGDYIGSYIDAANENRRLKAQLVQANHWHDEALKLGEENARYRALMGVKTDPPIAMVFARTLTDARGPFSNTRLADAGASKGVVEGNPVLAEHGLVGRITGVSQDVSRIMLLTDTESRTPVMIARTNARAILTGDGGPTPKLNYLRSHDPLVEGDRVTTSGDGGVYPRGLPVGVVVKDLDGGWRVALDADASPIDYVQILLFRDFSQLLVKPSAQNLPSTATAPPDDAVPAFAAPKAIAPKPAAGTASSAAAAVSSAPAKPAKPSDKPGVKPPARPDAAKPAKPSDKPGVKPDAAKPAKPTRKAGDGADAHKPRDAAADAPHKPAQHPATSVAPHHAPPAHPPADHEEAPF